MTVCLFLTYLHLNNLQDNFYFTYFIFYLFLVCLFIYLLTYLSISLYLFLFLEWLCSVANDCRRVTEDAMISQCRVSEQHSQAPKGIFQILIFEKNANCSVLFSRFADINLLSVLLFCVDV